MLGWQVLKNLQVTKNFKIFATYKSKVKLSLLRKRIKIKKNVNFVKFDINKAVKSNYSNFDYIINCIGIIKPYIDEKSQSSIQNAIKVNSLFPHNLLHVKKKTKIFQIATDCVFDGKNATIRE